MKTKKAIQLATVLFLGVLIIGITGCRKPGCTDENADNYDDKAKNDDGTCVYDNYLSALDQTAYDAADGINGGKLYDKFWATETGWTAAAKGVTEASITDYGDFYRCKQCHGWDLDGNTAAYIDRCAETGRPAVAGPIKAWAFSSTTKTIRETFDAIKGPGGRAVDVSLTGDGLNGQGDPHPNYGTILTDGQIWDLVKFLREEASNCSNLYTINTTGSYSDCANASRTFTNVGNGGSASAGNTFMSSTYTCLSASCHGPDGLALDLEGKSLGQYGRLKPYETQFQMKFGHLGSAMTGYPAATEADIKNVLTALTDTTAYPDQ